MWSYRPVGSREAHDSDVEEEADDIEYKGAFNTDGDNSYIYFAADFEAFVQGDAHEACMGGVMELDLDAKTVDEDPAHVHVFEGKVVVRRLFSKVVDTIKAKETQLGRGLFSQLEVRSHLVREGPEHAHHRRVRQRLDCL